MTKEQEFITQLYVDNREFLLRIALIYIKNEADAEDLVHDVFTHAMDSCDELIKHKDPKAWLVATLKNCIRNYRRRLANKLNVPLEECGDLAAPERETPLSHLLPEQLSEGDMEMLKWRIELDMSYREISKRLGISEPASRVKMSRIIKRYRKLVPKEEYFW